MLRTPIKPRILLTTTLSQDTPGPHHDALVATGWEVVTARGALAESDTLALVGDVDGYICGDDAITRTVLEKARPRLRVLSKYGIGVDKIDVEACTALGIPLLFTPGLNHTTVTEHAFLLLLALEKNLLFHTDSVRSGGVARRPVRRGRHGCRARGGPGPGLRHRRARRRAPRPTTRSRSCPTAWSRRMSARGRTRACSGRRWPPSRT